MSLALLTENSTSSPTLSPSFSRTSLGRIERDGVAPALQLPLGGLHDNGARYHGLEKGSGSGALGTIEITPQAAHPPSWQGRENLLNRYE